MKSATRQQSIISHTATSTKIDNNNDNNNNNNNNSSGGAERELSTYGKWTKRGQNEFNITFL